ncbi:hypothetical protein [Streptomyces marincola]|uniref:Uncharacterized protein n=1 Tax=Streptomyces marincola TaxID=2878388 RepID=A0A1W7D1R8_9ACTN|nr:hypothetical protein [Streptomyces marincola]ARQ70859.1 hypothetical protein CAG99_20240 [Streptomyces marincola]
MTATVDAATAGPWRPGRRAGARSAPLPWLPLFPAVPEYGTLCRHLADGGFRHVVEALLPPRAAEAAYRPAASAEPDGAEPGFRVLDGLWLPPERGHDLRRADAAECLRAAARWEASGDARAGAARHVLDRLARAADEDPMALRRLTLYQLSCLLTDEGPPTGAAALALGVDRAEAELLADAVAAGFPPPGPAREAAEELADAHRAHHLRRARRLIGAIPAASADPGLARLRSGIDTAFRDVARELADAARHTAAGRHRAAATACLRAARTVADDEAARAALLAAAVASGDSGTTAPVAAVVEAQGGVRLSWSAPGRAARFLVLRWAEGDGPETAVEVPVPAPAEGAIPAPRAGTHVVRDPEPPTGRVLRYAVVPWDGRRVAGIARATAALRVTPEVTGARAVAVPDGLRLRWQPHPAATAVRAVRLDAPGGDTGPSVDCGPDGLTDRPLPAGSHTYLVTSAYPGEDGEPVWSPGQRVTGTAEDWPAPVPGDVALTTAGDGRVSLGCRLPARGEARLAVWRGRAPEPGEDISRALPGLSFLHGEGNGRAATVLPPRRAALRVTAVSVLGERAVAGPSALIETLGEVADLTASRRGPDLAEVAFAWPEPAVLVLLRWESGGRREERRVPRSLHGAGPLLIPVDRAEWTVTAVPVARPDATFATSAPTGARLPALPLPRLALHYARRAVDRTAALAARRSRD